MDTYYLFAFIILSIITGAVGDGLFDRDEKFLGKLLKDLEILIFLFIPLLFNDYAIIWGYFFLGYIGIRFALFDYIYNLIKGNKLTYISNTGWLGKFMTKLNAPPYAWLFARIIFLIAGISGLIKAI